MGAVTLEITGGYHLKRKTPRKKEHQTAYVDCPFSYMYSSPFSNLLFRGPVYPCFLSSFARTYRKNPCDTTKEFFLSFLLIKSRNSRALSLDSFRVSGCEEWETSQASLPTKFQIGKGSFRLVLKKAVRGISRSNGVSTIWQDAIFSAVWAARGKSLE